MIDARHVFVGFILAVQSAPAAAADDEYPSRPIKLVVPFAAGGGTDTYARIIKRAIERSNLLPQPLVIINQGGGGATIGSRSVKEAEPDGHTMLVLHDAILTARIAGLVDYGPEVFTPIAATGEVGMVIAVADRAPYRNLRELMTAARDAPGSIAFGMNIGALTHFAGLQLQELEPGSRFKYAQIGGGALRFSDLKAGHIEVTGFSIEEFVRFRSDGLRGLAFFGEQRHAAAPDVPTAREQGFNIVSRNTFYWWFPQGAPPERVEYMADVLRRAMETEEVRAKLAEIHCAPIFLSGEQLQTRLEASRRDFDRVEAGLEQTLPYLPSAILALTIALACGAGWTLRTRAQVRPPTRSGADILRMATLAVLTLLYVFLLQARLAEFRLLTAAYIFLASVMMSLDKPKRWIAAAFVAVFVGGSLQHVFTHWLIIDLPSAGR